MEVIYGLIPSMIVIGLILIGILFWAIKSGQFEDFEGDSHRILMDDDLTPEHKHQDGSKNDTKLSVDTDKTEQKN
jgi:cbb3-type cytochrome oxidase maturation protein